MESGAMGFHAVGVLCLLPCLMALREVAAGRFGERRFCG
jgi:hypothetical protein